VSGIVWEDPPPKRRSGHPPGRRAEFAAALKERPGRWAKYGDEKSVGALGPLTARYGLEVTTRKNDDGTVAVYARWNAPEATP